jgi:hypothetical protein
MGGTKKTFGEGKLIMPVIYGYSGPGGGPWKKSQVIKDHVLHTK